MNRIAPSIPRYLEWMAVRGYSEHTIGSRRRLLERFADWCATRKVRALDAVDQDLLEAFRTDLWTHRKRDGKRLTFGSQAQILIAVRGFFRWAARQRLIAFSPAAELELPRIEQRLPKAVLTAGEADHLMNMPDLRTRTGLRDRAMLEVLYSTGIRRIELVNLKLFDVDWGRSTLAVRQGKGHKDRMAPLGERAQAWLSAYCRRARPALAASNADSYLFVHYDGGPVHPRRLTAMVRGYLEAAGIDKPGSCHLLRHTAATLMLENGADIRFIQALLGHAKLDTTTIYTRVSIAKLAAVHRETHPGARRRPSRDQESRVIVEL